MPVESFRGIERLDARTNGKPLRLFSIDPSGTSLRDERFLDHLRDWFAPHGAPHDSIGFGIPETPLKANPHRVARLICQSHELGRCSFLDDFGVGMSSLARLKHHPVDCLGIDRSVIKDMQADPIDRAMVIAIDGNRHLTGMRTPANRQLGDALRPPTVTLS